RGRAYDGIVPQGGTRPRHAIGRVFHVPRRSVNQTTPPPLISARAALRLAVYLGMMVVVAVGIGQSRNPRTWLWVTAGAETTSAPVDSPQPTAAPRAAVPERFAFYASQAAGLWGLSALPPCGP